MKLNHEQRRARRLARTGHTPETFRLHRQEQAIGRTTAWYTLAKRPSYSIGGSHSMLSSWNAKYISTVAPGRRTPLPLKAVRKTSST